MAYPNFFFVMHGVNEERKRGKVGRGRFGTGKSAAFGIASTLRVTTVRKCKRSKVELKRTAIEAMSQGDPVPVSTIDKEVKTEEPNGTTIEIEDLNIKHVDQASIIKFIEKHIYHWPNATVFVNHHEIELTEPPINFERRFRPCEPEIREAIGDVELVVKVSKSPLELEQQGIAIMSDGVWHENTLAGLEKKEFANFMFGEIDVPKLNADNSNISPFDLSRSMTLNRSNEMVLSILSFVGSSVESVRRELVTAEKARRAGEEARQLERHASEISEIINTDFSDFKTKLKQVHAKGPGGTDTYPSSGTGDDDIASKLIEGTTIPAVRLDGTGGTGTDEVDPDPTPRGEWCYGPPRDLRSPLAEEDGGEERADKVDRSSRKPQTRGGFTVEFREMGSDQPRAKYENDERTIYINLDHPQLKAAKSLGGVNEPTFRRLSYEVAFSEYALGLAYLMDDQGQYIDTFEPIRDIRETLNRISRSAARLYKV